MSQKAPSFLLLDWMLILLNGLALIIFMPGYLRMWLTQPVFIQLKRRSTVFIQRKISGISYINIKPTRGLDISIGESIVYADQLEILYLIPITFFRLADHYLSRQAIQQAVMHNSFLM